jgi:hypothetical protein
MEAKSRFRLLHEKPEGWISGETASRFFIARRFNHEIHKKHENRNEYGIRNFSVLFVPP